LPDKIRVAVVFGGRSTEHSVSCASASMVLAALDPSRYEVVPIGITRDGRWVLTSGDPGRLGAGASLPAVADSGAAVVPVGGSFQVIAPDSVPRSLGDVDVVLPLLHGAYGEDGTIQGLLELTGTRYAGAGVLASAAGMDKAYMKLLLAAHGLPIGPYVVVRDRDWRSGSVERKRVLDEILELGLPVFVKPARGGSSIGITRVTSWAALEPAIEVARTHDPKVLVEAALDGIEVECAVLEGEDGGPPEASVPGQVLVDAASDFYDFEAKYLVAGATMRVPADVPDAVAAEIRRLACAAFDALGCEGLARVDFFYTSAGQVVINEINTMPGMTAASGFPMMWAATGLPMADLMDRIIRTALAKRPGLRLIGFRRGAGRVVQAGRAGRCGAGWAVRCGAGGGAGRVAVISPITDSGALCGTVARGRGRAARLRFVRGSRSWEGRAGSRLRVHVPGWAGCGGRALRAAGSLSRPGLCG
jgi:D-alanine--D-alanine ligase